MGFLESLRLALEGLRANKMRAALTMLGIIIGIAAVIGILTVGDGLSSTITGTMSTLGASSITVTLRQTNSDAPGITEDDRITEEMIEEIIEEMYEDMENVEERLDELFEKVIAYVESKLYEPLTIAEICLQFSLSRSSLQLLFKNTVNQSPKKYISDMKLEKSCQLLRENKYTVSEIALKLGYSSIHYFSNAFRQKYHVSPSEYAKRIC